MTDRQTGGGRHEGAVKVTSSFVYLLSRARLLQAGGGVGARGVKLALQLQLPQLLADFTCDCEEERGRGNKPSQK